VKKTYIDAFDHIEDGSDIEFLAPSNTEPHAILERERLRHVIELALIEIMQYSCTTKSYQSVVNKRSVDIIKARYGIDTREPVSLEMIGRDYDIGKQRVYVIVNKVLRNLRQPRKNNYINELYEYLKEEY
jgi:DNA-directed RNA polymerase sigma subunit (sigma70/sigma32)